MNYRLKLMTLVALISLSCLPIMASELKVEVVPDPQAPSGHSVALSWTVPAATTGVTYTGFNVYRALCTGTITSGVCSTDSTATFTKLAAGSGLPATASTFTDSTVTSATNYIYYVTSLCAACTTSESVPSNHVTATIPATQPPPPTLTITNVAKVINGTTQTITAQWMDTSGTQQNFNFTDGHLFVGTGLTSDPSGSFVEQFIGPVGSTITFIVCNATGFCLSQVAV